MVVVAGTDVVAFGLVVDAPWELAAPPSEHAAATAVIASDAPARKARRVIGDDGEGSGARRSMDPVTVVDRR
jgi:hypothetical protein